MTIGIIPLRSKAKLSLKITGTRIPWKSWIRWWNLESQGEFQTL